MEGWWEGEERVRAGGREGVNISTIGVRVRVRLWFIRVLVLLLGIE